MKPFIIRSLLCLLFLSTTFAQDTAPGSNFHFHTPETWKGEVISLPPGFAPDLAWHGIESIKFAPGMFQADSDSFFSYVLVFLLSKDDDVSEKSLHTQILTYYRGLAKAVMGGKRLPVNTDDFKLALKALPTDSDKKDISLWEGTLEWTEPFATQKAQTLNIEIQQWKNGDQPVLYFTVSPRGKDHAIWKEMRVYRDKFEIK